MHNSQSRKYEGQTKLNHDKVIIHKIIALIIYIISSGPYYLGQQAKVITSLNAFYIY
ncbi:hypothetical protein Hanom_Chr07g00582391 [Helianthus anomalus]